MNVNAHDLTPNGKEVWSSGFWCCTVWWICAV